MRAYGYLGLILIIFAEINFYAVIQPFATWYIPIVWWGFILFVDSLVYEVKKRSLLSSYPGELVFLALISVPFWSIFEVYNIFTHNWHYIHYVWYIHLIDFTIIMPSFMETFSLLSALNLGKRFDVAGKAKRLGKRAEISKYGIVKLLPFAGAIAAILPIISPEIGFPFIWFGLFLLLDPLNYLTGRPSILQKIGAGKKSMAIQMACAGLITGFFWECWNYQAYPKWFYNIPQFLAQTRLFEMPLPGYLGYITFMAEVYLFFAFWRPFIFKGHNDVLSL